jgi:phenylacetate-CoA ligase
MQDFWGCKINDCYGSTQSGGLIGMTCPQGVVRNGGRGSVHFTGNYTYVEVLNPEANEPAGYGNEGEVTLTLLVRQGTPVVRFRMRDKVRIFPAEECNCGSSFDFLEAGTIGRYDDMIKIKACNIWPQTVDNVVFSFKEAAEYNGIVWVDEGGREMVKLQVEFQADVADANLKKNICKEINEKVRALTQVSMKIEEVPGGTLEKALFKSRRWKDKRKEGLASAAQK